MMKAVRNGYVSEYSYWQLPGTLNAVRQEWK
jgi:hypothetical protein